MHKTLEAQRLLVPEMMETLQTRYEMLKYVNMTGPVGRRPLSQMTGLSERETRTMMDLLKNQSLINVAKEGASITENGLKVLYALEESTEDWSGLSTIGKKLTALLNIRAVHVVSGNSDTNPSAKGLLGMEAAKQFVSGIGDGKIVAVTGGSTIASIPQYVEKLNNPEELLYIAARGGVGEDIGLQANVIAASFAKASGGRYSTFYYPESLSEEAHDAFRKEPSVVKMMKLYETADCVLHGIGNAQKMAVMRNSTEEEQNILKSTGAKGEAFGYYFDASGKAVHRIRTVGIQTDQLERIPLIIAVAGGSSKAEAILSYMASAPAHTILITDEGSARIMLTILTS